MDRELLKGSTTTLVLNVLSEQPLYGYALIKRLRERSNGVFALKEGTLYPILHSLEAGGMVEAYWDEDGGARRRKYYRITDKGRKCLQEKQRQWSVFRAAMDRVLGEGMA